VKIEKIEVLRTSLRYKKNAFYRPTENGVIVKIHTSDGITGVGEVSPIPSYSGETQEGVSAMIEKYLAPGLIGLDPLNLEKIIGQMDRLAYYNFSAKTAIDAALHDIAGKYCRLPVCTLLGGRVSEQIPVLYIIFPYFGAGRQRGDEIGPDSPEINAAQASEAVEKYGIRHIKLKWWNYEKNRAFELERVKSVRKAVGDEVSLWVDINGGLTPTLAIQAARELEEYHVDFMEQPTPRWDFNGLELVTKSVGKRIGIIADDCIFSLGEALEVVRRQAADGLNVKPVKMGGLYRSRQMVAIADAANLPCLVGRGHESSVGTLPGIHLSASSRTMKLPGELSHHLLLEDDLTVEPVHVKDGCIRVPEEPGLGFRLDEEKVKEAVKRARKTP